MKIICIGRNYAEHAAELKNEIPSTPLIFMKPQTAILKNDIFEYPPFSDEIHFEVELVYKISKTGRHIVIENAKEYYDEIALGIDFTARDLQSQLKLNGHPWELAKGFDGSAYVSKFSRIENKNDVITFQLFKNNQLVQDGDTRKMIFSIDQLISYASQFFTLEKGDLIFTGTPAGVGKVEKKESYTGILNGNKMFELSIK